MSRDGHRRRVLTQDERVLWTIVTKSVAPLRAGTLQQPDDDSAAEALKPARPAKRPAKPAPATPPPAKQPPPPLAPPLARLGRRMRARVARGKEAIDGRLDLHGLTQSEAHSALLRFLRNA